MASHRITSPRILGLFQAYFAKSNLSCCKTYYRALPSPTYLHTSVWYILQDDNHNRTGRQKSQAHLEGFLATVRSLGVSLRVYKVGEKWEWTSLLGGEKRLLLRKLPHHFSKFLPAEKVEKTQSLWNVIIRFIYYAFWPICFIGTLLIFLHSWYKSITNSFGFDFRILESYLTS